MKALVITDGALNLEERPTPEPAADQVVIEVAGAGVNRADLLQLKGGYAAPPGWPEDVPGLEFSGIVAARGPGCRWIGDGDHVFGIAGGGAHATHLLVPEGLCAPAPDGLDLVSAGGIPEVFVTAFDALVKQAHLKLGERVLIHGAGSGVGTAAVQIVRAVGATSVGTARTPAKLERARELGLDAGVTASDDMAAAIGEVDVVLDLVGGDYLSIDTAVCRPRGRILLVGLLAGAEARLDMGTVLRKRLTVIGTVLRSRPEHEKAAAVADFGRSVVPLLTDGKLRPVIERVVPLDRAEEAYGFVRSNSTFGKVVLSAQV